LAKSEIDEARLDNSTDIPRLLINAALLHGGEILRGMFESGSIVSETRCPRYVRLSLNLRHDLAWRTSKRATSGLSRFWSGRAEMGKTLFRGRGAEIWKRRELDATSRPFSRPTWLDTAG
jgi:hypothetical protein